MNRLWNNVRFGGEKFSKDYFLKPKGLQEKKICTLPKEKRNYDFLNWRLQLYRTGPGKDVEPNVLTFQVDKRMTKPEIKQYLEKVYELPVERVNTTITHGEIKKNMLGQRYKKAEKKKAYVFLKDTKIDDFYKKAKFLL